MESTNQSPFSTVFSMANDHYSEHVSKAYVGLSILLSMIFWAVFTWLLLPFVPAESALLQLGFAGFTALCLTGVFFLATHMFKLVLAEHRKAQR
jgi:hypothetical protein